MKNIFTVLSIILMSIISCSQTDKKNMNEPVLTSNNYVETMLGQIKHFPKESVYQVYVKNSLCLYEVLVNDLPVARMFEYGQVMTPYDINDAILKSGKQKITLRLYPAPAEYSRSGDVLSPNISCNLEIEYVDNKDPEYKYIPVAKFKLPTKNRMAGRDNNIAVPEFEGAGKKYYEITYEFDAQVPYENEGWFEGQDLTKLDQKLLEKEVLKFYQNQWDLYNKKDVNGILSYMYKKEKEVRGSLYNTKEDLIKVLKSHREPIDLMHYKEQPIKDYKMVLYGNNKMITLELLSQDTNLRHESALWGVNDDPIDGKTYYFNYRYLYLPKGKKLEDGLEIIR